MERMKHFSSLGRLLFQSRPSSPYGAFVSNAISSVFISHRSISLQNATSEGSSSTSSTEELTASQLNDKIMEALNAKIAPEKQLLHSFLNRVHSSQDVDLAFATLARLREENCAYRNQFLNFKESVSVDIINACIRANVPKMAMKALHRKNIYGLTPTLNTLHLILNHASSIKDVELLIECFRTANRNGYLKPSQSTAKIIFNAYLRTNDVSRLLKMGKEFVGNGIFLEASLHDVLIAAAANTGRKKQALEEIAKLREEQSVPLTWSSGISMAKIFILKDDVTTAADYILTNLPEKEKQVQFETHMKHMFHTWPKRLPKGEKGEPKALPFAKLRDNLAELESKLKHGGLYLPFTVESDFPHHLIKPNLPA